MTRLVALLFGVLILTWIIALVVRLGRRIPSRHRRPQSHWNADGRAKKAYRSHAAATKAAERYARDFGHRMAVYECERGGHYHYGHPR